YLSVSVPEGTIERMLKEAVDHLGIDFPLADFLSEAPNKAFLTGVTAGRVVNTVTIDGVPCDHLFFFQPPGIELELWLEKNDRSLPRRQARRLRLGRRRVVTPSAPGVPGEVTAISTALSQLADGLASMLASGR